MIASTSSGADPMVEINEKLYLTIGKFFPFAVGAKAGVSTASVLDQGAYKNKQVVHLDAIYFFKYFVKKQVRIFGSFKQLSISVPRRSLVGC